MPTSARAWRLAVTDAIPKLAKNNGLSPYSLDTYSFPINQQFAGLIEFKTETPRRGSSDELAVDVANTGFIHWQINELMNRASQTYGLSTFDLYEHRESIKLTKEESDEARAKKLEAFVAKACHTVIPDFKSKYDTLAKLIAYCEVNTEQRGWELLFAYVFNGQIAKAKKFYAEKKADPMNRQNHWAGVFKIFDGWEKDGFAIVPPDEARQRVLKRTERFRTPPPAVAKASVEGASADNILNKAGVKGEVLETIAVDSKRIVFVIATDKLSALEKAKKFLAVSQSTGYVPLFIMDNNYDEYLNSLQENHSSAARAGQNLADSLLAKAEKLDIDKWLTKKSTECKWKIGNYSKRKNTWSRIPTSDKIILVPVKHSWQIPAIFYIGGWNECPSAEVHIALHKRWHEKYGSEFLAMGIDSVYCLVDRPIKTKEDALKLAEEHGDYCWDNVHQGAGDGTLSGLANDLIDSTAWQFWWD